MLFNKYFFFLIEEVEGSIAVSTISIAEAEHVIGAFATPAATWTPVTPNCFENSII